MNDELIQKYNALAHWHRDKYVEQRGVEDPQTLFNAAIDFGYWQAFEQVVADLAANQTDN